MARTAGTTARIQRLTALVAIELVALAVGFAFGRVFIGHSSTYRLLAVSVASALVAWIFERRSLLLATAVSAVLLVVAIGIIVFPVIGAILYFAFRPRVSDDAAESMFHSRAPYQPQ